MDHPADGIDTDQHGQVIKHCNQPRTLEGEFDRVTGAELPAELGRPDETGDGRDGREDQDMHGVALADGALIIANRFPFALWIREQAPHML